jgi:hypothetical protein
MKKRFLLVSVCVLLLSVAAFGQSITFQPYLSFDWDPLHYDPVIGDQYGNYRAFNFEQAGLKVTGNLDKVTAYVEVRGFPKWSRDGYNKYDGLTPAYSAEWEKPVFWAWGKYQFTETGNIWAGKFKPLFGPYLFDWEQFGIGWQQKIAGAHTVSAFLLQPNGPTGNINPYLRVPTTVPENDNEGVRILITEEWMTPVMMLVGGVLYDYLPQDAAEDASKVYLNVFATYWGIPNLSLTGEIGVAIYSQKDGIIKDTDPEDSGFGIAALIGAEYKIIDPVIAGLYFAFFDPLVGAKTVHLLNGESAGIVGNQTSGTFYQWAEGEVSIANLGLYVKFSPGAGFFIQPGIVVNLANALNNAQPLKPNGDDGAKVGANIEIRFRWEPSFTLEW